MANCDWCSRDATHFIVRGDYDSWIEEELSLCDRCYQSAKEDHKPIILDSQEGGEDIRNAKK